MSKHKHLFMYFWGVASAVVVVGFFLWLFYFRYIEYTDDAYVHGNQVYITPLHSGFVTSIHTDDSFLVEKGQLLVSLDTTDAEIALERAKETLAQTVREVCELFHEVFVARAEIDLKTAELIRDAQDYLHRDEVFRQQAVSIEDYEHAIAALKARYSSLQMSATLYHKTLAAVQNTSIHDHPLVIAAKDQVRDAWVRLYRCNIYSPVEGLAAQRTIQVGMWVSEGQPLISVIPLDQIWVNANYKETQLKFMRLGQKVNVTADLWGVNQLFHGTIVGLPGGAGNAFSLLPPQNLSGNWIKIVQRLPVRVALDPQEIREHPLRVGLSCRALIDTRHPQGVIVPETTAGSPLYATSIFDLEEQGDHDFIESIIFANLDPLLADYAQTALQLPYASINLNSLLKEAFKQDTMLQEEVFKQITESHTTGLDPGTLP